MTVLLRTLIQESASPLVGVENEFAIDSTGFGTRTYDRWVDEKWGKAKKRQKFVKAHAICGTKTHIVTDVIVNSGGDAPQFEPLLDATCQRFTVEAVSADKAYLSKSINTATFAAGAIPYIPFKVGITGQKGPELWRKMFHYYAFKREEFDRHYHRRSTIETAFSMVKAKFGAAVRGRTTGAQTNEVLCKFLCHNIVVVVSSIYELKLAPEFWKEER